MVPGEGAFLSRGWGARDMVSVGSWVFSELSSEGTHFCPFSGKKGKEGPEPVTRVTRKFGTL